MPYKTINRVSSEDAEHSSLEQGSLLQKIYSLRRFFRFFRSQRRVAAMIVVVLIVSGGYGVYEKYFHLTPEEIAKKELAAAVEAVSGHMILPEGDEPVLATVTDAETLIKQQAFFAGAVNGDQLLLFPRNVKAILYSPSRNKIVNVGPIQQSDTAATAAPAPKNTATAPAVSISITDTLSVEIRNGTGKTGYVAEVANKINSLSGYSVIKTTDAGKKDYARTVIFNRSNSDGKKQLASMLAATLNGDLVTKLPNGEKDTEADVLVILGGNE